MVNFLASGAFLRAFLKAATFLATLSWAFNAALFSGDLAFAILALIEVILALMALIFFSLTLNIT
jgi:hypothetical protein